ncbi:TetR/AcrR family transcriptional regulator [Staphylococcus sp. NRL 16/872]|uniref:TetR/AcrR family transcriptional regulator n=1 Tax=Staphylococcus sp. NRL 16/872 TaxID=2930131 RepID=UPI001FB351FD|nr:MULTISPECIES: TetR/AcrR family transcriptional regulator [unclassified Staphylococcus]MCJ1655500.1 TetR/AcrR family transcriptional regulator [Staphylococcus sp. NRL 21/187]MCJ1661332.1 TetR/AcrR family transcriptional regulator [Staphylococcus sp. NRL 18/288]MCJ1667221.1 TetR/AcrR family transcriptional regulator [Staphylococcus sp. NRL 19/737]WEN69705.1 TetR/AcrR family transcriptional regulator [Staphylococcus sp. NRL 16/872]
MVQDRRVRKSQNAIKYAFLELLNQHNFNEITVQQITDLADINRGTFYTHYLDKYDLLEKMEDEQVEKVRVFIEESKQNSGGKFTTDDLREIMEFLISHIEENIEFYQLMFKVGKDSTLHEKLYSLLNNYLNSFTSMKGEISGIPFSYFMSYVSGAGLSFLRHWVEDNQRIPKEDLINYFYDIVNHGPATIIQREINK